MSIRKRNKESPISEIDGKLATFKQDIENLKETFSNFCDEEKKDLSCKASKFKPERREVSYEPQVLFSDEL